VAGHRKLLHSVLEHCDPSRPLEPRLKEVLEEALKAFPLAAAAAPARLGAIAG
jgi:hypothetical protein